jgi:ribonuclease HIII
MSASPPATLVFELDPRGAKVLGDSLAAAGFRFGPLAHAQWQARGEGVIASLYKSGKLVVQGREADGFSARFLQHCAPRTAKAAASDDLPAAANSLGSDEAGKGDTFGPLCVVAVAVDASAADELARAGVADSKTLTDARVLTLAEHFGARLPSEARILQPPEYNAAWAAAGRNVNKLLTKLHAECLSVLQARTGHLVAVVDRFSAESPVRAALARTSPKLRVTEVPRGERHLAVAAASVLARAAFLEGIAQLEERAATDLPLGSGTPIAPALRRYVEIHGVAGLGQVAKLHFKNVQRFIQDEQ